MRAAVLKRFGRPLVENERPEPRTRRGEFLVRIAGCGVCLTDVHIADGRFSDVGLPRVLRHETAGRVEGIGDVLVYNAWGCGSCAHCRRREEHLCPVARFVGFESDGGYAEEVAVPARRHLLPLRGLDPVRAAPLADAGITPYRAVRRRGRGCVAAARPWWSASVGSAGSPCSFWSS